jgi:nucleoid-associated protein YgaU
MKIKTIFTVLLLVTALAFSSVYAQSYNYEEMTQEQYNAYLAEWQGRLDASQTGINEENTKMDGLKAELDNLQAQIDAEWDALYAAGSSDQPGYNSYGENLGQLRGDAGSMLNLSPEDLYSRMNELDDLQAQLDEVKKNPFSATSENAAAINSIQSLITQAKDKGAAAIPPSYTVVRGDYLWKIAAKADIYGDAYAWMRIYTSNKDQISNPDLIYAKQVFSIPRQVGPNEHLVARGEHLSKIAGYSNVYGSPFQWQKLYEANKTTIADPSLIYPHQVLKIAR